MGQKASGICPLKPVSCSTPQVTSGWPGSAMIGSGLVIQEPVPQTEQPPSGGISGQGPSGVGAIGALVVGAEAGNRVGEGVGGDGAKVSPNGLHSQTPIPGRKVREGSKEHILSGICPLKPSSCRTLQLRDGCPGNTKIASGILIQEPVPQTEQPPSGGIFGQAPGGVETIGGLVGSGDGAKVGTNALHSQTPIRGGMEGQKASGICPV